jgi:hypothetical protein
MNAIHPLDTRFVVLCETIDSIDEPRLLDGDPLGGFVSSGVKSSKSMRYKGFGGSFLPSGLNSYHGPPIHREKRV